MEVSLLELFARGIPEGALFILASYIFTRKEFSLKRFIISSLLLPIVTYFIRKLPIQYGVNNILSMLAFMAISIKINKINTISSIKTTIVVFIIQFLCEGINILLLQYLLNIDLQYAFSTSELKVIYGLPSLLLFGIILIIYYAIFNRRKKV
jgi:hypothetical protein